MIPTLTLVAAACTGAASLPACGCAVRDRTPDDAYRGASAVLRGRVVAERERPATAVEGGGHVYTVVVSARWKGSVGDTVEMATAYPTGSCHASLRVGAEYVLYPRGGGRLSLSPCHRSVRVGAARADLQWLGPPSYHGGSPPGAP